MQAEQILRNRSLQCVATFILVLTCSATSTAAPQAQMPERLDAALPDQPVDSQPVDTSVDKSAKISFAFDRTPWRDVIRWLSDNCNLALHYEDLPTGSFTYSDKQYYSEADAINRVNLFLLPQGYTLVRSGSLLSVINLGDPRSDRQLDALAQLASLDQLETLPVHTVVKCLFPLDELEPEDAVRELSVLNLMKPPAVLSKTKQLLIIDTVGKLRSVRSILDSFEPKTLANGTIMKSFALEHVTAEDILVVARPHLGLATDEMIGIDVSLSADLQGKHIFVTGVEDRVQLIENLVQALDQPAEELTAAGSDAVLLSYTVQGGNAEQIYNVLQTLLAGKSLRLSVDEDTDTIVALASPEIQSEIEQTIAKMEAAQSEFEVIPLKSIDPYFAISLLEEMLDLPSDFDDDDDSDGPKIDADPGNMRLFVRGKRHEIEQIKTIVAGLDEGESTRDGSRLRVIPSLGEKGRGLLKTAARLWAGDNAILLVGDAEETEETERVVSPDAPSSTKLIAVNSTRTMERYLNREFDASLPVIRCLFAPRGLIMECEDPKALDDFEAHFKAIVGPIDSQPSPPIVFYLKFTKAAEAVTMLAELLDGGESAREGAAGTLVNGYVSTGSFLGSIVTARDGTITMTSGSITVVADPRLNRLIAQGSDSEIEQIEDYLKIIDKSNSITEVEVYGKSHVIEIKHSIASEIAQVLREAYAHHLAGGSSAGAARGGSQQQPQPRAEGEDDRKSSKETKAAPKKPTGSAAAIVMEPKMTIAVHEPSNSLIVTAPEQLLEQVKALVAQIDQRSEQTMEVVSAGGTALQAILAPESARSRSSNSSSRSRSSSSSSRPSLQDILRSRYGK